MRPNAWNAEEKEFLRTHYASISLAQLAHRLKRTEKAVRSMAKVMKVQRGGRHVWTGPEEEYLRLRYAESSTLQMADELGLTVGQVYQKAKTLGLAKSERYLHDPANRCRLQPGSTLGSEHRFHKGHVPANLGLRLPGYAPGRMKETQFKKGTLSGIAAKLHWPVGTILADHEGYLRIKVREHDETTRGWHKNVWPLLSHHIWTQANGLIPEGHLIVFQDRDRNNCTLENLELITLAENARRNVMWNRYPREVCEVVQLTGALKRRIKNAKKQGR